MGKIEVRCPVCQTNFVVGSNNAPVAELNDGIHYLVPETVRNENDGFKGFHASADDRMKALRVAGVNIDKLQSLMSSSEDFKTIFNEDDPILEEISKGGFIRNPELFRRWITAQTFALIGDGNQSWTSAVRKRYDIRYVFKQTREELYLQLKLINKGLNGKDRRFQFFTLDDMKQIFRELTHYGLCSQYADEMDRKIYYCTTYQQLANTINEHHWSFRRRCKFMPQRWLNCFKGAGAYYTLQNIIRTHGFILPSCTDMQSSLDVVESMYNEITSYSPSNRRWDMLMSLLMTSVLKTNFELKW